MSSIIEMTRREYKSITGRPMERDQEDLALAMAIAVETSIRECMQGLRLTDAERQALFMITPLGSIR